MQGSGENHPSRRQLIAGGGAAAAELILMASSAPAAETAGQVANTRHGKIRGTRNGDILVFRGIPYGASTAGGNRFMAPRPPNPWAGIRDASRFGDQAPQGPTVGIMEEEIISLDKSPMSEDCLRLNVWTAGLKDGKKRPVMVWFHGGGFAQGSGGNIRYDGTNLAREHEVVLVTVNHRLNAFGFLYLGDIGGEKYADSGNAGMLDAVAALNWVRDNAEEFGGDPGNVTVFGQSGGGGKTTTLMAMPQAVGRFHRAIAESGLMFKAVTAAEGTDNARKLLKQLGLQSNQADQLQKIPYREILAAMGKMGGGPAAIMRFAPVLDHRNLVSGNGPFDPAAPSLSADVPLLLGSTLTEITFMNATPLDPIGNAGLRDWLRGMLRANDAEMEKLIALYTRDYPGKANLQLYQQIATDNWMTANVAVAAERKAALRKAPAFVYHFEKLTPVRGGKLGSPHTLEIPYVFDNMDIPTVAEVTGRGSERQALADKVSGAWTHFARTGDPGISALPKWRPYSATDRAVMILNDKCDLVVDPYPQERVAVTQLHLQQGQISRV